MQNVVNITKQKSKKSCNLTKYESQVMACPVTKNRQCHFIFLADINGMSSNPGRSGGTQQNAVSEITESLITNPKGQEEPICLEWNPATAEFDIVFGFNREWATNDVYNKGYEIANHPSSNAAGIWAWVFTGTSAERTALQMRENGNKNPQSPATKQQMVDMLKRYIKDGGLTTNYADPFGSLTDAEKYDRAKAFMVGNTPFWGVRRFKRIWNKLTQDGSNAIVLDYTTYSKEKMAKYFCKGNPYGIKIEDLGGSYSGSVVEINNVVYGIYFIAQRSEINGALVGNATRKRITSGVDHLIIVGSLNDSSTGTVGDRRVDFEQGAEWWNGNVSHTFDEMFWMPQTQKEKDEHLMSGTWARQAKLLK